MMGMRKTDLGELYALLKMYGMVYGGVSEELIGSVEKAYEGAMGGGGEKIGNPRGAGRKSRRSAERIREAKGLQGKGYKLREIAKEMGCSVGHVHKLINEHADN